MKKTLVIIIIAVYIASIAVVNFFGLEIKNFEGVTYVSEIKCETVTVQNENPVTVYPVPNYNYNGGPLFIFDFIPSPDDAPYTTEDLSIITNPNAVQINCEALPHNADNSSVKFIYDEASMDGYVVFNELSRTFVFLRPNKVVTITIESTDGSNKSTKISIMGKVSN